MTQLEWEEVAEDDEAPLPTAAPVSTFSKKAKDEGSHPTDDTVAADKVKAKKVPAPAAKKANTTNQKGMLSFFSKK